MDGMIRWFGQTYGKKCLKKKKYAEVGDAPGTPPWHDKVNQIKLIRYFNRVMSIIGISKSV